MQLFRSAAIVAQLSHRPVSAKKLRMWCAPELILGVTTLSDEQAILPHIIDQARSSGAKIILAHAQSGQAARNCRNSLFPRTANSVTESRDALDRMARQLRWLGFTCEPIVLSATPELEIPYLVRSCGVDRVLIGFEEDPDLTTRETFPIPQQVLRGVDVPVCAISRHAMLAARRAVRSITLAVSAESSSEVPLSFACRLAQENRAKLTVLHVADKGSESGLSATRQSVLAALPSPTWREAELFCPTEIVVRAGEPVQEILSYCSSTQQDLIILCSAGETRSMEAWKSGVSYRTIAGSQCPVFVACGGSSPLANVEVAEEPAAEKFSALQEKRPELEERRSLSTGARRK